MRKLDWYSGDEPVNVARRFADSAIAASQGDSSAAVTLLLNAMSDVIERLDREKRASELQSVCNALQAYNADKAEYDN
jgi:hypothetical protein